MVIYLSTIFTCLLSFKFIFYIKPYDPLFSDVGWTFYNYFWRVIISDAVHIFSVRYYGNLDSDGHSSLDY